MRVFNLLVFDTIITGSGTTWYSRSEFNDQLGLATLLSVQACVSNVSGGSPTLTVVSEHSPDSERWIATSANEISAVALPTGTSSYAGGSWGFSVPPLGARVRYRITLGGTNPQCRLKLYVTGHDTGA